MTPARRSRGAGPVRRGGDPARDGTKPSRGGTRAGERRGGWPALRAGARLAWRSVVRSRGSSTLVALLVALPVAGLTGAAVFWETHRATPEQAATLELGSAQSWVSTGPPGLQQAVDDPRFSLGYRNGPPEEPVEPPTGLPAMVPATAVPLRIAETGLGIETPSGRGDVMATIGAAWDPLLEGRYVPIDGTAPAAADEAMVSPGLLERLDARVGDTVTLSGSGETFTITGTMRRADQQPSQETLFLPGTGAAEYSGPLSRWYFADWQPTYAQLRELTDEGYVSYARDLAIHPPPDAVVSGSDALALWNVLVIGAVTGVFSGYLVVLLAGAALAVSARRQQRALAVAASVGAARRDVFRVVLLQGAFLGAVGAAAGIAVGAAGAAITNALTDRGAVDTFWGNWGYRIPVALVAAIAAFALLIGTLAAIAPARSATRGDPLGALRGARRPAKLDVRRPVWGLALLLCGAGLAVAGGLTIAALGRQEPSEGIEPLRVAALWTLVLGPVVFQVGVILGGHWIFVVLSRLVGRAGHGARLASRDAAASPSRVVPAFAAIAATVFAASFVLSVIALQAASSARMYSYSAPAQSIVVSFAVPDGSERPELTRAARELLADAEPAPAATALVRSAWTPPLDPETGRSLDPDASRFGVAQQPDPLHCPVCDAWFNALNGQIVVVAPEDIEAAAGVSLGADALRAYRDGAAVASIGYVHDGDVTVTQWRAGDLDGQAMGGLYDGDEGPDPTREIALSAIDVDRRMWWAAAISPETADALGIVTTPSSLVARYETLPPQAELDRLAAEADRSHGDDPAATGGIYLHVERGPDTGDPWLAAILAVAAVLVVGASAVSLGLSRFERRADDATLAAVGGGRMLRRGVNAWQALLVAGVGTVVGTVAGQIPVWGFSQAVSYYDLRDTPWPWLAALALALPAAIAVISWLVPPRHPDITRRTAIA